MLTKNIEKQENTTKDYLIPVEATSHGNTIKTGTTVPKTKYTSGITLIALVITIIILLILAGIVLNLTIGENGIITRAQQAGINYDEAGAREKLELALLDLQAEKAVNSAYNETTYIDNYLTKKQMTVNGNIVTVGKWQFEIDRSVPKIASSLGKGDEIITEQKANLMAGNMTDGKIMLKIEIALPNDTIQGIEIYDETNSKIETINVPTGIKQIQKEQEIYVEFMENKTYYAKIIGENSNIQTNTVNVKNENIITTASDLKKLGALVNSGETFEGKIITQVADIDLSTVCGSGIGTWEPIGYNATWFNGTYDGNRKSVTNLYINNNADKMTGLFGFLGYTGIVKNLTVSGNINSTAYRLTGGIVGRNEGTIDNCTNNANVQGVNGCGGITGGNFNTIKNCINNGNVIGKEDGTGGIVGNGNFSLNNISSTNNIDITKGPIIENCINSSTARIEGTIYIGGVCGISSINKIDKCTNEGTVIAIQNMAGGIVGKSNSNINGCKNTGIVTSNGNPSNQAETQGTGGIVGRTSGTVSKCANTGAISSSGFFVGGVVGFGEAGTNVNKSYNHNGKIQANNNGVGGIIGRGDGVTIENCYNYLSSNENYIKVQGVNAGGIIGTIPSNTNNNITNCYSIGSNIQSIEYNNYYVGAIIGATQGSTNITNVYYENTNPLQSTSEESTGINGTMETKSTEDFKKSVTDTSSVVYLLNGNSVEGVWEQDGNINGGYPYLKENRP